ncbi:MAG TPA: hypothetical protein VJN88_07990 [Ktedonobacterales bacterium]|nr:hypothetical protein [Ktedonobacterales bacterium]
MEPVLASSLVGDYVTALLIASVPGVLVALLTQYLTVRRQNEVERQMVANAQLLLSLEFEDNQQALATFWTGLNALDKEESHPDDQDAHLIAIVRAGLLNQTIPRWSHVRWQHVSPRALAEISPKDLAVMDQCYRDLDAISDLFTKLITLNPDEKAYLDGGHRFWYNNFPDIRKTPMRDSSPPSPAPSPRPTH